LRSTVFLDKTDVKVGVGPCGFLGSDDFEFLNQSTLGEGDAIVNDSLVGSGEIGKINTNLRAPNHRAVNNHFTAARGFPLRLVKVNIETVLVQPRIRF